MDFCITCGKDVWELGSHKCLGVHCHCDHRLCFSCYSITAGLCPTCEILGELDSIQMNPAKYDNTEELYEQMGVVKEEMRQREKDVIQRRQMEEEEKERQQEKPEDKEDFDGKKETTENFILRRKKEMEKELRGETDEEEW